MTAVVFVLCVIASLGCAVLLARQYRAAPSQLLLFSALAFVGLTLNNVLVYVDLVLVPQYDLAVWRKLPAVVGMALLVYALVREPA